MKPNIEEILATSFMTFELDGTLIQDEEFFKLSRKAAILQLQKDLKEEEELELDLAEDTAETISYLQSINDAEYEQLKNDYR
ncbi:hypothetical protein [Streptococcus sanguinis]|uniref:hypothetical protein n=1 Tax=Streptococcus sanguinis TaxID=1305 RepID=UPI0007792E85|nr:hypothetical protein [Streptococcus sanguinis]